MHHFQGNAYYTAAFRSRPPESEAHVENFEISSHPFAHHASCDTNVFFFCQHQSSALGQSQCEALSPVCIPIKPFPHFWCTKTKSTCRVDMPVHPHTSATGLSMINPAARPGLTCLNKLRRDLFLSHQDAQPICITTQKIIWQMLLLATSSPKPIGQKPQRPTSGHLHAHSTNESSHFRNFLA